MIYLDNIASTKIDRLVYIAMMPYLEVECGNASSIHKMGLSSSMAIENARMTIADKIKAKPEEIVFTSGGTESNNLVFWGVFHKSRKINKHIIISSIEHPSVYEMARHLESKNCRVTFVPVDKEGLVDPEDIRKSITKDTILVSVMLVNNEIGSVQPIAEIGKICRINKIYFHTDAGQGFTKVEIDVVKQNLDFVTLSGHKIYGPKGVGALYIRKGIEICPLLIGGSQENGLRPGTYNTPGIVGFGKAVEIAKEADNRKMAKLRDFFIKQLMAKVDGVILNGPSGKNRVCNNINVSFINVSGKKVFLELNKHNIMVSTGSACAAKVLTPSRVIKALGYDDQTANGALRIGLSKWTTKNEVHTVLRRLVLIVKNERKSVNQDE